jgi:hypothetical protein
MRLPWAGRVDSLRDPWSLVILSHTMTKDAIKEHLDAVPFRPFTVRLPDGRSCPVPARDFASLSPNGRILIVFTHEGDGVRLLDVALIVEIEASAAA